jgi:hypothetical protein
VLVTRDGSVNEKACSFEVLTAIIMKSTVFWILAWLSTLKMGVMFLRNVGFSPNYTPLQPRKPHSSCSCIPSENYDTNSPSTKNNNVNRLITVSVHVKMFYDRTVSNIDIGLYLQTAS